MNDEELLDLVHVTVHDLYFPLIKKTENGITVDIANLHGEFSFDELTAKSGSAKDFIQLLKDRIGGWR